MRLGDPNDYSVLGVNLFHFSVGAVGGFMRSLSHPERRPWHRAVTTITGAFAAGYLTPVVAPILSSYVEHFGVTAEATSGLTGFLLGIGGLTLCEAIILRVRKFLGDR